ncbi:uncharacterized protein BJX67DRAFT_30615 [Aspergillus lucknowensis]|uniref:Uncharacterized protein n=1 Tax=Aspergillus lucknowensis TaxID=176173 RepID=A0ABR4LWR5_9EURO
MALSSVPREAVYECLISAWEGCGDVTLSGGCSRSRPARVINQDSEEHFLNLKTLDTQDGGSSAALGSRRRMTEGDARFGMDGGALRQLRNPLPAHSHPTFPHLSPSLISLFLSHHSKEYSQEWYYSTIIPCSFTISHSRSSPVSSPLSFLPPSGPHPLSGVVVYPTVTMGAHSAIWQGTVRNALTSLLL